MAYPLMLYRGGCDPDDYLIVEDEAQEAEAVKDGYARLDLDALKAGKKPEPVKRGPGRPRKVQP